jgi:hypothetical protein
MRTGCAKTLCWGTNGKRGLEVPELSGHGTIDNLQFVFPGPNRPKERSEKKVTVAATNYANPRRGERPEETAAVAATNYADRDPGKHREQAGFAAACN